ncbi:hypothetical protein PspLS_11503 [Pyricularia sp. CBS 133598]|nr:hypothetical protein PspLS_11503 [Pyricularia sp. CBS 133598]
MPPFFAESVSLLLPGYRNLSWSSSSQQAKIGSCHMLSIRIMSELIRKSLAQLASADHDLGNGPTGEAGQIMVSPEM